MFHKAAFYGLLLLTVLLMCSCNPQTGVLDLTLATAVGSATAPVELDALQPAVMVFLTGLPEDRLPFLHFQAAVCTTDQSRQDTPHCRAGENDGDRVRVLPIGGAAPDHLRPEEIGQVIGFEIQDLHAVYRSGGAPGEYGLLFERREAGAPASAAVFLKNGFVIRIDLYQKSAAEALNAVPLGWVLLAPADARAWSEPLKQMSLTAQSSQSDDRRWIAHSLVALPADHQGMYYHRLVVANTEGDPTWIVVDRWSEFAGGYTVPLPHVWSRDGSALYWTQVPTPDGCVVFANGSDLHRLDLATGRSAQLLDPSGTWIALSPDQGRVAVIGSEGLKIYNVETGRMQSAALPEGQGGMIVWSPDGRALALTIVHQPCADPAQRRSSILRVDTDEMKPLGLIVDDGRGFSTLDWSALGEISLADSAGETWRLDPLSGEIWSLATGDPAPTAPSSGGSEAVAIRFHASIEPIDGTALRSLAGEFSRYRPGYRIVFVGPPEIDYDHYSADEYLRRLSETCDCFSDMSLPDEFRQRSELLMDLSGEFLNEPQGFGSDYLPGQLDIYRQGEMLRGLPLFERPMMISYNAELLESLGLDSPSTTWQFADFERLARDAAQVGVAGARYGFSGDNSDIRLWLAGLSGSALDFNEDLSGVDLTRPEVAAALERMNALRQANALLMLRNMTFADAGIEAAGRALLESRIALWSNPAGLLPAWYVLEEQPGFRIGAAPLPRLSPQGDAVLGRRHWQMPRQSFYILKTGSDPSGCAAWGRFLSERSGVFSGVPARLSVAASAEWENRVGAQNAAAYRQALEQFYRLALPNEHPVLDPILNWMSVAARDYLDGADAGAALQRAQHKVDAFRVCLAPVLMPGANSVDVQAQAGACYRQVEPGS